ncbi:MAG: DUF2231 domain-containing protein [Isosphaeraceae bacterium]
MDVIAKSVDKVEEMLGHSPHPAIVTVPLGAFTVSTISDVLYMATGSEGYDDAASISMAVGLIGAAGSVVTGLRDYSHIPKRRQPSHKIATTHALGNAVVGTLFTASYIMRLQSRSSGERASVFPRLLALAGGGLSLYTAWLGGKLVEELGEAVKPAMERSHDWSDEGEGRLEAQQSGLHQPERDIPGGPEDKPLHELIQKSGR